MILVGGRRIGKTLLSSIIANYTMVQLLEMNNPHGRLYDVLNTMKLAVTCITLDRTTWFRHYVGKWSLY